MGTRPSLDQVLACKIHIGVIRVNRVHVLLLVLTGHLEAHLNKAIALGLFHVERWHLILEGPVEEFFLALSTFRILVQDGCIVLLSL